MSLHIIREMERKRWEERGREKQSVNRNEKPAARDKGKGGEEVIKWREEDKVRWRGASRGGETWG